MSENSQALTIQPNNDAKAISNLILLSQLLESKCNRKVH